MKTENKQRWMIWAIILLAVLNVSTIITVIYHSSPGAEGVPQSQFAAPENEAEAGKFSGRYFRDHLGFSGEQMNRFVEFNPDFRQTAWNINVQLNRLRQEMLSEMTRDNYDIARLDLLSDSIGRLHSRLKKATYKYYLDIKGICDPQQQEKLKQLFSEMFASDVLPGPGHQGKGMRGPRHRGRQSDM